MKKRAYISVYDKDGIDKLAEVLIDNKFEIVSTGGTFKFLKDKGFKVTDVSQVTGCSEMLGGKVKSLHPAIFAGILADTTNSKEASELEKASIAPFDMVVVNLYPFEQIAQNSDNVDELVKNIDIGGVALLRAGAKNYKNVTVVCDKKDYSRAVGAHEDVRQELALKAFSLTSAYDDIIKTKLAEVFEVDNVLKNDNKNYVFEKVQELRYGENPHQDAGLYKLGNLGAKYSQLWGKELSYNNILDITSAVNIVSEFYDVPAVAIVKHQTPCGVALGKSLLEAYQKAFDCDPISAFGGIVAFSQPVTKHIAKVLTEMFLEVVIAPEFENGALEVLKSKKNLRLIKLETSLEDYKKIANEEIKITPFGVLIQSVDKKELDKDSFNVVTKTKPTKEQIEDAVFAWKVAKYARSNAIVVAKDFKTLAIGQGQTNRVCAMEWALDYACDESKDAVVASDGFFPAVDNIQAAAQGRIALIIQPGGSIKDKDVIAEADKYNISMITTGIRHFKH